MDYRINTDDLDKIIIYFFLRQYGTPFCMLPDVHEINFGFTKAAVYNLNQTKEI